jgi:hypothetical protein
MAGPSRQGWSWAWTAGYCTHCYRRQEGECPTRFWTFCTVIKSSHMLINLIFKRNCFSHWCLSDVKEWNDNLTFFSE